MATETPVTVPSAQVVGNAFVEQYYHILHQSPELVYRFYQDLSVLSRPAVDGVMSTVSTMDDINAMILSLNSKEYKAEIKTVDAQYSHKDGVTVLVTGCLSGKEYVGRKFTQSFFLAPQEKGYYVRNDVFRYLDDGQLPKADPMLVNGTSESITAAPVAQELETSAVPDIPAPDTAAPVEEELSNGVEVSDHLNNEEDVAVPEEVVEEPPQVQAQPAQVEAQARQLTETGVPVVQEDAPKKSYASIVKVSKGNAGAPVNVPATTVVKVKSTTVKTAPAPAAAAPVHGASSASNNASSNSNVVEEVEGHSIYIKNLPVTATDEQVEKEFKSFGPIKPGGVQVRSNKGFCFGFVEFEKLSSMQDAVKAGSVTIASRQVFIEEKRTTTRVGGRGRFGPGRGGFRNDFRGGRGNFSGGRGDFSGGRGFPRNDFGNRGEGRGEGYPARRGPSGGRGEGYQPVEQNGNGKVAGGRQGGNQATVTA